MKRILLIIVMIVLVGCSTNKSEYKMITTDEVKDLINNNEVVMIDVRSSTEYQSKHIENAINIPLDSINRKELENVISSLESNIIVYCMSGYRSKQAVEMILDLGYINVYDLGSIDNWSEDDE